MHLTDSSMHSPSTHLPTYHLPTRTLYTHSSTHSPTHPSISLMAHSFFSCLLSRIPSFIDPLTKLCEIPDILPGESGMGWEKHLLLPFSYNRNLFWRQTDLMPMHQMELMLGCFSVQVSNVYMQRYKDTGMQGCRVPESRGPWNSCE